MVTLWTVVGCVAVLSTAVGVSVREPFAKLHFMDSLSLDRGQWLAFGIAVLSVFGGIDGLIAAAIWASVPPEGQARPAWPVAPLVIFGVIGAIGFVIMSLALLRVGPWRRRIVLDVRCRSLQFGRIGDFIEDANYDVPPGKQPRV